jgi:hypothetical protein
MLQRSKTLRRRGALATCSALAFTTAFLGGVSPARAACTTVVCLAPNAGQSVLWNGNFRTSSTGLYKPIDVWNMGGGNFNIAFALPLAPLPVVLNTGGALPNAAPINLSATLNAASGAYAGAAGGWSFVAGGSLPAQTLNVTAYEVHAGPNYVGIALQRANPVNTNIIKTLADVGFAVQAPPNQVPAGNVHWVQVIADNFNITNNPGWGNAENIIDIGGGNATPYYDVGGAANGAPSLPNVPNVNFFDAPIRNNQANLNQSDWWIANLFLATGPANNQPGKVTLYNDGIQYGWANFHISVGNLGIPGLRRLFALDTSSLSSFDLAMNCPQSSCALNSLVTTGYLNTLDADLNSAVPEPSTWAMMLMGFSGLVFAGRRQRCESAVAD